MLVERIQGEISLGLSHYSWVLCCAHADLRARINASASTLLSTLSTTCTLPWRIFNVRCMVGYRIYYASLSIGHDFMFHNIRDAIIV